MEDAEDTQDTEHIEHREYVPTNMTTAIRDAMYARSSDLPLTRRLLNATTNLMWSVCVCVCVSD